MKIIFAHEGLVQEFTPPDFATQVTIKTRANGISIDYVSSTVKAVEDYFQKLPADLPVNPPAKKKLKKRASHVKLTDADRDAIIRAWTHEKPTPRFDELAARYGVHRTTIGDIIKKAMKKPYKDLKAATVEVKEDAKPRRRYKQTKTWSRKPITPEIQEMVKDLWRKGDGILDIAAAAGVSKNSVQRIVKAAKLPQRQAGAVAGPHHKGGHPKALTTQEENHILSLREAGMTIAKMAGTLGISESTIKRLLAKKKQERLQASLEV